MNVSEVYELIKLLKENEQNSKEVVEEIFKDIHKSQKKYPLTT